MNSNKLNVNSKFGLQYPFQWKMNLNKNEKIAYCFRIS